MDNETLSEIDENIDRDAGPLTIEGIFWGLYGWAALYDEPLNALIYSDITSPKFKDLDSWEQWKHEHWAGYEGIRERALSDPVTHVYLEKYGLLPEDEKA